MVRFLQPSAPSALLQQVIVHMLIGGQGKSASSDPWSGTSLLDQGLGEGYKEGGGLLYRILERGRLHKRGDVKIQFLST